MRKLILYMLILFVSSFTMCTPDTQTQDEKEAVKGDTLNVREGTGEGEIGEGDIGS